LKTQDKKADTRPGYPVSGFKNIPDKIMVLGKGRKIVMPAAMDSNKGNMFWIEFPESFTVRDRDDEIFITMKNIGSTVHSFDPFVGTHMIAQYPVNGQKGQESLYCF
jgi:hypothetical protein